MVFVLKMVIFYSYVKLPEGIQNDIMIYHDLFIHLPRAKKNLCFMVSPWLESVSAFTNTFYQNNGSPAEKTYFSNKPSFCVCTCLAKRVRSYIDLLSLQTQPLMMK